jgi:ribosomal protein S18 acetylase RimI-like enzyme
MEISYRKLTAADAADYRDIRLESLRLHPESFGASFEEQRKLPKLMFETALEEPTDERFVIGVFDQQALSGICGFVPFASDNGRQLRRTGTIIQMYVKAAYRGRKIGLNLVKAALEAAFQIAGIEQVMLGVAEGNISAIRVYEQAGFQPYRPEGSEADVNKEDGRLMIIGRNH